MTLDGTAAAQEVVTFSTTIGNLSPGTALTNASGLATASLSDGGTPGAGTVTAEVTIGDVTVSDTVNFQISSTVTTTDVDMGNGVGGAFVADAIDLGGITSLAAGGTLTATVSIVETSNNNAAYATPVVVNFSSTCVVAGTATMDAAVTTTNGIATSTYLAQGCTGSDTITASADVGGLITASGTFTVQSAGVGSIEFVSSSPEIISLQGTGGSGGTETSVVTFRVVDAQGTPVSNQVVNFALDTVVGGLSLSPASATSDQNGLVQTVVQSGTVATSVSVTATTTSGVNTYQTQSSQLVVTTGIPDQNSFSLSATVLAPEAWGYDGVTSVITARLADRFNNPVPDGTAVTFTTEGGSIESSCTTTNGACSVTWTSQNPRPCGETLGSVPVELNASLGPNVCQQESGSPPANSVDPAAGFAPLGQPYGGRVTILATAVGEESFIDGNGNGVFDDGDIMTDLPEAWLDENEDGGRDNATLPQDGLEPFADFNANGVYDSADGEFNGVLCSRTVAPLCSSSDTMHVRQSLVLVMAGSGANIAILPDTSFTLTCEATEGVTVRYSDLHHQPMPAGTTVSLSLSHGSVTSGGSYTQPDTNANGAVSFRSFIKGSSQDGIGQLVVTVRTPKGLTSTESVTVTTTGCP